MEKFVLQYMYRSTCRSTHAVLRAMDFGDLHLQLDGFEEKDFGRSKVKVLAQHSEKFQNSPVSRTSTRNPGLFNRQTSAPMADCWEKTILAYLSICLSYTSYTMVSHDNPYSTIKPTQC